MATMFIYMSKNGNANFGENIKTLRLAKGMTQTDLGIKIGLSKRMVYHYERYATSPPADKLSAIAKALGVSVDQILGNKKIEVKRGAPKNAYLRKKIQQIEHLPKADQKVVIKLVDALAAKKGQ